MADSSYVLITPAKNEESFIGKTLESVILQTVRPERWVIVSDGSTDRTDEIVGRYAQKHAFIQHVTTPEEVERTFNAKVKAFNFGYALLKDVDYDFIGILDADVSFDKYYYQNVLAKFSGNAKLGIAGGIRFDWYNGHFTRVICAPNSVGGPFQFFRRQCFEDINGFIPVEVGGEDAIAEITARMKGWEVRSFADLQVYHHRCTGTATGGRLRARFRDGKKEYLLGYHPLFEIARCLYRTRKPAHFLENTLRMVGYTWSAGRRYKRPVSDKFINYLRAEQIGRLKGSLFNGKDPLFGNEGSATFS